MSLFEGLEVPKLYRSSIVVWPALPKTPAPLIFISGIPLFHPRLHNIEGHHLKWKLQESCHFREWPSYIWTVLRRPQDMLATKPKGLSGRNCDGPKSTKWPKTLSKQARETGGESTDCQSETEDGGRNNRFNLKDHYNHNHHHLHHHPHYHHHFHHHLHHHHNHHLHQTKEVDPNQRPLNPCSPPW